MLKLCLHNLPMPTTNPPIFDAIMYTYMHTNGLTMEACVMSDGITNLLQSLVLDQSILELLGQLCRLSYGGNGGGGRETDRSASKEIHGRAGGGGR